MSSPIGRGEVPGGLWLALAKAPPQWLNGSPLDMLTESLGTVMMTASVDVQGKRIDFTVQDGTGDQLAGKVISIASAGSEVHGIAGSPSNAVAFMGRMNKRRASGGRVHIGINIDEHRMVPN